MSIRTGRFPLISDPIQHKLVMAHNQKETKILFYLLGGGAAVFSWFLTMPDIAMVVRGPDNALCRVRHKRYPTGYAWFGWGNNGLNRDCNLQEAECWAGYMGKEYTY